MENIGNVASAQDDGASEKLVGDEKNGHHSAKGNNIEVKYVTPNSQNGDAKIDIDNLKSAFAGMGKEELMKFANDPFWVKTRWFLFILFWLLWAAMLAGAIAIIVMAPKCAAPAPREWWEQSPVYKVDVASYSSDKGDLAGVTTKLDYIKSLGVKTVVLSSVIKATDLESDGQDEFKSVSQKSGTWDDFKALITAAKDKGLHILLTFVPNHSSVKNPLFLKSASKEEPYTSYYIWAPSKGFDSEGKPIPPNNWLSVTGGSAWQWHEGRKEFYLHQFDKGQADLNFRNKDVVNYITDALKFWLDNGVSGLYLDKAQYLFEDEALRNASISRIAGYTHDEYDFYEHVFTSNQNELIPLMKKWKELASNSSGIISVGGEVNPQQRTNESIAHLEIHQQKFKRGFTADDLEKTILSTTSSITLPVWELKAEDASKNEVLQLTSVLLPGTAVIRAGQELGLSEGVPISWDNSTGEVELNVISQQGSADSSYSMYHALIEARKSPSILYGIMKTSTFNNTVFAYTRLKSGNPGFLVVSNIGDETAVVDLRQLSSVPDELSVIARTENLHESIPLKNKLESNAVSLPSKSVAVFSFVPKSED